MGIDYYGVLQTPRTSTDLEIKKAFRNLALEFHENRSTKENAKQVFALICEAYDVLSNHLHRAVFDQYGEEGLKRGVPGPEGYIPAYRYHGEPMRTYKSFFGTTSPYADLLDVLRNPPEMYNTLEGEMGFKKKQPPIKHPLSLTLHEIFFGGVKKMKIRRLIYMDEEQTRTEVREKILTVPIKPGIKPGTEIIFPNEGDQNPTQIPADVIFITEDRPHEIFVRDGDDLLMVNEVTLEDALCGTVVTLETIDHRTIRVPITDVISPTYTKIVENEGMPILDKYPEKGNLIIKFILKFPSYLPKTSKELLKQAFSIANEAINCHNENKKEFKLGNSFDEKQACNINDESLRNF